MHADEQAESLRRSSGLPSVAVVGAGIIGLSVAWRLAQAGWAVTIFDRGRAAAEASWAGAGMLALGGELQSESPLLQPALESRRLYPGFVAELSTASAHPIDFQLCGALDLAFSPEELDQLNEKAKQQARFGIASKPLSPDRIAIFWPHVAREDVTGGRFYPEDAVVDPRDINGALLAVCRNLGVVLHENTPITHLVCSDRSVCLLTSAGTQSFSAAVIAAGAWSSQITVENVPPLPRVEPVKGVLIGYRQPEQTCPTILRHAHAYLLQRSSGLLIAGTSEERTGFDRAIDSSAVDRIAAESARILPHLAETTHSEAWTGLRPYSETLHVGNWHSDRLYLAYGHFRNGILLAPWTARVLAEMLAADSGQRTADS